MINWRMIITVITERSIKFYSKNYINNIHINTTLLSTQREEKDPPLPGL